jgi:hypothetical protein
MQKGMLDGDRFVVSLVRKNDPKPSSSTPGFTGDPVMYDFTFTSSASSYVGRTQAAVGEYNAVWTIEGVPYNIVTIGTIPLYGNHKIFFRIDPSSALTVFNVNSNSLSGYFPDIRLFSSIVIINVGSNELTGQICSFDGLLALQEFYCAVNNFSGSLPSFDKNTALKVVACRDCGLSGPIPNLSNNTLLQSIDTALNSHTGSIPNLNANTALTSINVRNNTTLSGDIPTMVNNIVLSNATLYGNSLTGVVSGFAVPASLGEFYAQDNLLSQAAVDAILAAFVAAGRTSVAGTCVLDVGATGNAAPSSTGLTDKATLVGRGWTVTNN